jgi:hypothetical protein
VQHFQGQGPSFVQVNSPFERDVQSFSEAGRQSILRRTPGMAGAYGQALKQFDLETENERQRLIQSLFQKFANQASFAGYFMNQSPAERAQAKDVMNMLPSMSLEQLRALAGVATTAAPVTPAAIQTSGQRFVGSDKQGEGGDIRKADIAAGGQNSPAMPSQTAPYIPKNLRMADISEPTRPAEVNLPALLAQADAITKASSGTAPNVLTTKQGVERIYDAMREAGFDPKFFEKRVGELTKEKEQSKLDRREAAWLRTLEGAFETLGGESPYGFVNFGKGAAKAVKGIQEDLKDIKKIDRERDKAIRDVQAAEQDFRKSAGLTGLKEVQESQNRLDRFNEQRANRTNDLARTLYSGEIQKYVAMQPTGTERIIERSMRDPNYAVFAEKFAGRSGAGADPMADIIEHYAKNPLALERLKDSKDPQEIALYNAIKARLAAMSVPSASTRSTGIVRE